MTDSRKHENRLLTKCRKLEEKNRQLTVVVTDSLIDWLSKQKNQLLIVIIVDSRSFSQTHDHFCWFTMRIMKMKCNHRFQRKNFRLTIFFWFAYFYKWFDDFLLNTRVFLRTMKTLFLLASFTSNWRFSFISRIFTKLTILFCLFAYLDEQSVSTKRLIECQLVSQNSEREICCAKNSESSSLRINKKISCWKCAIVTN